MAMTGDQASLVVDAVDHAVIATAGAMQSLKASFSGLPTRCGRAASEPYGNSTAAVATFSGSLVSARRAAVVHAIAKSLPLTGRRSGAGHPLWSARARRQCPAGEAFADITEQCGAIHDVERLLKRLKVFHADDHGGRVAVLGDDDAAVLSQTVHDL
jgi:hypothetical protein